MMDRRKFLRTSAGGVAGVAAGPLCGAEAEKTKRYSKFDYIDIHTHLGTFVYGEPLLGRSLVGMMDRHHVEKSVVLPLVSPEASRYPQTTEAALGFCKKFPDRLIPFCCVDPRSAASTYPPRRPGHVKGVQGLVQILKRYRDAGCRGFGEHKVGLPFDEPRMMQLYEACAEVKFPILFHLDDIRNWDEPGLPRLKNALKAFPETPFIGHAAGFWASISGDATLADFGRYPEIPTPVAPGGALDRLMKKYPNLYGDLSEPGGERAMRRDPEFAREFIIRNAGQLLFGTDFLKAGQEVPHFEILASMKLPEAVEYQVYRGNAIRLLNLDLK